MLQPRNGAIAGVLVSTVLAFITIALLTIGMIDAAIMVGFTAIILALFAIVAALIHVGDRIKQ